MSGSSPTHQTAPHRTSTTICTAENSSLTTSDPGSTGVHIPVPTPSDTAQMQPFRFFDLPVEIRSMVLHFVLAKGAIRALPFFHGFQSEEIVDRQLLATSRTMQEEALPVLFGHNTINIPLRSGIAALPSWITQPSYQIYYMREVHIKIFNHGPASHYTLLAQIADTLKHCKILERLKVIVFYSPYREGRPFHDDIEKIFRQFSGLRCTVTVYSCSTNEPRTLN